MWSNHHLKVQRSFENESRAKESLSLLSRECTQNRPHGDTYTLVTKEQFQEMKRVVPERSYDSRRSSEFETEGEESSDSDMNSKQREPRQTDWITESEWEDKVHTNNGKCKKCAQEYDKRWALRASKPQRSLTR